jgi:hypothetical protein
MASFIQICASQNDLFALDADGDVHQYHFNVKTWVKLVTNRESEEEMAPGGAWRQERGPHDGERMAGEDKGIGVRGASPGLSQETATRGTVNTNAFASSRGGDSPSGGGEPWNRASSR